jgi:pimeloyl-ACP methyl ester carboxylesterase
MRLALEVLLWGGGAVLSAAIVAWAALQRPDIPWARLERKYANAHSRFMDLPGGLRVHYRDQGNRRGPPIVMVHGFAASLHAWEPWLNLLGDRYRIVTLDLPAHGLTRAPTTYALSLDHHAEVIDEIAQRLNLGRYVVVGNSMGGGAAWTLALAHSDNLRGLVLVDPVGAPMQGRNRGSPLIFKLLANPLGQALLRNLDTRPLARPGLKAAYVDPTLVTPALVDRYVDLSRAPGHRAILLNSQGGPPEAPPAETFHAIATPTLIMHGEADALIPVSAGRWLAQAIPGARLITYPGVGHVPMEQIPDRSAQDLRLFLESLDLEEPASSRLAPAR